VHDSLEVNEYLVKANLGLRWNRAGNHPAQERWVATRPEERGCNDGDNRVRRSYREFLFILWLALR